MEVYLTKMGFLWFEIGTYEEGTFVEVSMLDLNVYNKERLYDVIKNMSDETKKELIENSRLTSSEKKIAEAILNNTYTPEFHHDLLLPQMKKKLQSYGIDVNLKNKALHKDGKDE